MKTKQVIKTQDGSGNIIIKTESNGRSEISNGIKFTILVEQNHRLVFKPGQLSGTTSPMASDVEKAVKEHALFIVGIAPFDVVTSYFEDLNYTEAQLEWAKKYGELIDQARRARFPNPVRTNNRAEQVEATSAPEATPESSELEKLRQKLIELEMKKSSIEDQMQNYELDPDKYADMYDEWLDEASVVEIPGLSYASASVILREVDYEAYQEGLNYFINDFPVEEDGGYIALAEELEEIEEALAELDEALAELEEAEEAEDPNQMHIVFGY